MFPLQQLYRMKSDLRVTLFTDLGFDRLRVLIQTLPNDHMKSDLKRAFALKIKEFLQNSLRQLYHRLHNKKSTENDRMVLQTFKNAFLENINGMFPTVDEKKMVFDILLNLYSPLCSFLMQDIVVTHTTELKDKNLLLTYIGLIEDLDLRSEVMNTIGMKIRNFKSADEQRRFLLTIPNLDLAVVSTEKFARKPDNFHSFTQRFEFVSSLTDNAEKIRLFKHMLKEHPEHVDILNAKILVTKKLDNAMRQSYGLQPKHKVP